MRQFKKVIKIKAKLPSTFPNSALYHSKLFALDHLWTIQSRAKITELYYRLNDSTILGTVTHIHLQSLQE